MREGRVADAWSRVIMHGTKSRPLLQHAHGYSTLPGLPLFWRQKSDGGLGAVPPAGVKGAAPLAGCGAAPRSLARYGKNQGSKHCFKGISMFLEAINNLH